MGDLKHRLAQLSPKRLALVALELEERLEIAEAAAREPVAIIGLACRVPGADTVEEFWRLLDGGIDAIAETPRDRWDVDEYYDPDPDVPGRIATRWGGFLRDIRHFDPAFFGISRREARSMDPQQRLLLEVAWEALERAGQSAERLSGSATGVFVGVCNADYGHLLTSGDPGNIDTYLATGNAASVVSGRLSYVLGLQGPAVTIDTACSSSLVAIHAACQSLRTGESRLTIAGGVNVICAPEVTMAMSRSHMMSPDGRCKAFDAAADGFVRAEGCGVLVLKRLSDARADGDRVLALIRGSAVNQDGRSSGLTAPNALSQESVIRTALANAGVEPARISTTSRRTAPAPRSVTRSRRAHSLRPSAGARSPARPLLVGSVKTNIGHLESAAGVAGVIKVVLALQHRRLPRHLHFRTPSPHIAWDEVPLRVTAEATDWASDGPRLAGVSSFGFSGTNAHVVIEEAPMAELAAPTPDRPAHVLTISAKSDEALRALAAAYADELPRRERDFAAFCATATAGRAHFGHRLAVVARSAAEAAGQLRLHLDGLESRVASGGVPASGAREVAFLFTGQGAQYPGMGRELYDAQPVFRQVVDWCAGILEPLLGRSLTAMLYAPGDASADLDDTAYTQPAIFTIDYALAEMWRSWGIEPAVVAGHSLGEYAAACVAGMLTLEEALGLVVARGRLMQSLPREGAMVAVMTSEREVRGRIGTAAAVSIAAINGPESVVVTGRAPEVTELVRGFETDGIECRRLAISNGFHSPLVDPILDEFERSAARVHWQPPQIPLVSNLTGALAGAEAATPAYWRRHLREPVQFAASMQTLWSEGIRVFLETGPHSTLLGLARRCVPEGEAVWAPSLRRDQPPWTQVLASVASLYVSGVAFDWAAFERPYARPKVDVPTYRFQREECWMNVERPAARARPQAQRASSHPLLGARLHSAVPIFETRLDPQRLPMLGGHRVNGTATVPAAAYAEMGMSACRAVLGSTPDRVEALSFHEVLSLPDDGTGRLVQCVVRQNGGEAAAFEIFGATADAARWTRHATGRVRHAGDAGRQVSLDDSARRMRPAPLRRRVLREAPAAGRRRRSRPAMRR